MRNSVKGSAHTQSRAHQSGGGGHHTRTHTLSHTHTFTHTRSSTNSQHSNSDDGAPVWTHAATVSMCLRVPLTTPDRKCQREATAAVRRLRDAPSAGRSRAGAARGTRLCGLRGCRGGDASPVARGCRHTAARPRRASRVAHVPPDARSCGSHHPAASRGGLPCATSGGRNCSQSAVVPPAQQLRPPRTLVAVQPRRLPGGPARDANVATDSSGRRRTLHGLDAEGMARTLSADGCHRASFPAAQQSGERLPHPMSADGRTDCRDCRDRRRRWHERTVARRASDAKADSVRLRAVAAVARGLAAPERRSRGRVRRSLGSTEGRPCSAAAAAAGSRCGRRGRAKRHEETRSKESGACYRSAASAGAESASRHWPIVGRGLSTSGRPPPGRHPAAATRLRAPASAETGVLGARGRSFSSTAPT